MANKHKSTVLYTEAQIRREERRVAKERAEQRKLERAIKRINARRGY